MKYKHYRTPATNMGFSAMLAEEYILIVPFANQLHHGATFLRNVHRVYSASADLFIFGTGADESQNISTAESPDRWLQL